MIKKVAVYKDYNGEDQKDVLYFNLNKAELGKLQMRMNGKFIDNLQLLIEQKKIENLYDFFYNLLLDAYGEKDPSGKRFIKNAQIREDFENSLAFSEILMKVISNNDEMTDFIKGILPADMLNEAGDVDVKALPSEA